MRKGLLLQLKVTKIEYIVYYCSDFKLPKQNMPIHPTDFSPNTYNLELYKTYKIILYLFTLPENNRWSLERVLAGLLFLPISFYTSLCIIHTSTLTHSCFLVNLIIAKYDRKCFLENKWILLIFLWYVSKIIILYGI